MSTTNTAASTVDKLDLAALVHLRPPEIKTYHRTTYDRLSPSKTLDGRNKTVLITGGGELRKSKLEEGSAITNFP